MFYLKRNVRGAERAARLVLAIVLAAIASTHGSGDWVFLVVCAAALMLALTAVVGFCPACAMVGRRPLGD